MTSVTSPGRRAGRLDDDVRRHDAPTAAGSAAAARRGRCPAGRASPGVISSGRTSGVVAADGDLDVRPPGELQDGQRVAGDVLGADVAGQAGHGEDLGLGARAGVEEREAVVDAGVAVDEQRDARGRIGHARMLARRVARRPGPPVHCPPCTSWSAGASRRSDPAGSWSWRRATSGPWSISGPGTAAPSSWRPTADPAALVDRHRRRRPDDGRGLATSRRISGQGRPPERGLHRVRSRAAPAGRSTASPIG